MLDIRSSCLLSDEEDIWKTLIDPKRSYLMEDEGVQWRGYLYVKNPVHYKNISFQLSLYQKVVQQLLSSHNMSTTLIFEDKYYLLLERNGNSWRIIDLQISYSYNLIQPFAVNDDFYNIEKSSNQSSNIQQSVVIRKLAGKGLHQNVNITLMLDIETSLHLDSTCSVIVKEILP